jgi:hypothetical protein
MTSKEIQLKLARYKFNYMRDAIFLNIQNGAVGFESDMLIVRPSKWAIEIEIKISLADFKADFNKGKSPENNWSKEHRGKHDHLEHGEPRMKKNGWFMDRDYSERIPHRCRQFYFAVPFELVEKVQPLLPSHAGLIGISKSYVGNTCYPTIVEAPKLKARKYTEAELNDLYRSCYYKHWDRLIFEDNQRNVVRKE